MRGRRRKPVQRRGRGARVLTMQEPPSPTRTGRRMSKEVRAVATTYKGTQMRSILESQWAHVLDAAGIPWTYEPKVFRLPDGVGYLPDFYLPAVDTWVEVKGPHFERIEKTRALARMLGAGGQVLVGTGPGVCWQMGRGGRPRVAEIGYGTCRCGAVAVGPMKPRGTGGRMTLACRACGAGCWASGVLGW